MVYHLKLSYVCPKTWRFRKDELETVTPQTLETYFYISWDPRISVCFSTYYIFLVGGSKGPPPPLDPPLCMESCACVSQCLYGDLVLLFLSVCWSLVLVFLSVCMDSCATVSQCLYGVLCLCFSVSVSY